MTEILNPNIYNDEIAQRCVYGAEFVRKLLGVELGWEKIYERPPALLMTHKQLEGFIKLQQQRDYYQQNPTKFVEDFFQIQLIDSQAYLFQMAWITPRVIILASRGYGKSLFIDLFIMTKQMLASEPWTCAIAAGSSDQSNTTFKKLEDIAYDRIDSMIGSNGKIFRDEIVIPNANGDGFNHNPSSFSYRLYNDSETNTVNSNVDKNRGKRKRAVFFDESGFLDADLVQVYSAFAIVEKGFKTGFDAEGNAIDVVRLRALPPEVPNQIINVSSASNTDTDFYAKYRDYSKRMIMGDKSFFVAHIDCDLVMKPTVHGKRMGALLSRDTIDAAMRTNPEKARREYYCQFTSDAGANAIIRRGVITRNEKTYRPIHENPNNSGGWVICYDPARSRDNSIILVGQIYDSPTNDGKTEKCGRIVECVNLLDVGKKIRSPMQTPDQIEYLKSLIVAFNGDADGYGNLYGVYIDAGSGGGGVNIADYLMDDWYDKAGNFHRGLIDEEYSEDYLKKFPNAVRGKLHLLSPSKYKSDMYEALIELFNQNKIKLTTSYDGSGQLTVFDTEAIDLAAETKKISAKLKKEQLKPEEFDARLQEELDKVQNVNLTVTKLDWLDELQLTNIDAMKEEIVNMVRITRASGKDSFELTPEKQNKLHDDRAYCCAEFAYALMTARRSHLTERKITQPQTLIDRMSVRKPQILRR